MKTRISVIIPMFNTSEYLKECLDSVLSQTINDMELTDDESNDLNNIDLSEEELTKIKTISEYLFMDQYQDTCAYPRFEECFGAFCLEKSIDLPKVFKSLCGKKRKYI